jgi:hypothetical protein
VRTPKVYEVEAQQLLDLANRTSELYAKDALLERADELRQAAQAERQNKDPATEPQEGPLLWGSSKVAMSKSL